jgi:hypothetical protein
MSAQWNFCNRSPNHLSEHPFMVCVCVCARERERGGISESSITSTKRNEDTSHALNLKSNNHNRQIPLPVAISCVFSIDGSDLAFTSFLHKAKCHTTDSLDIQDLASQWCRTTLNGQRKILNLRNMMLSRYTSYKRETFQTDAVCT